MSGFPVFWKLVPKLSLFPRFCEVFCRSMVSFPKASEICLSVDSSFPPRNKWLSQFPRMVSEESLYMVFSCDTDCRTMDAEISRDRIVAMS